MKEYPRYFKIKEKYAHKDEPITCVKHTDYTSRQKALNATSSYYIDCPSIREIENEVQDAWEEIEESEAVLL